MRLIPDPDCIIKKRLFHNTLNLPGSICIPDIRLREDGEHFIVLFLAGEALELGFCSCGIDSNYFTNFGDPFHQQVVIEAREELGGKISFFHPYDEDNY